MPGQPDGRAGGLPPDLTTHPPSARPGAAVDDTGTALAPTSSRSTTRPNFPTSVASISSSRPHPEQFRPTNNGGSPSGQGARAMSFTRRNGSPEQPRRPGPVHRCRTADPARTHLQVSLRETCCVSPLAVSGEVHGHSAGRRRGTLRVMVGAIVRYLQPPPKAARRAKGTPARRTLVVPSGTTRIAGRSRGGGSGRCSRCRAHGAGAAAGLRIGSGWSGPLTPTNGSSLPRALRGGDRRWVRAPTKVGADGEAAL